MVADKGRLKRKEKKFFDVLKAEGPNENISDLCQKAGISTAEFYEWLKDEEFRAEFNRYTEVYGAGELGAVWGALVEQCRKGNIQAIKLFFDMLSKNKIDKETGVSIIDDIPRKNEA